MLYNKLSAKDLKRKLDAEDFTRKTVSFYKYFNIENPVNFRDEVYTKWSGLDCLGRVYIAREGINAQMNVPEHNVQDFLDSIQKIPGMENIPLKWAVEDDGKSFLKLIVKVREKIVADGLSDDAYNVSNVGRHLSAAEFHNYVGRENTVVVDMRNHYESEIGHFENAYCPDVDTFRDAIKHVVERYSHDKDKKFLLYCTGGIRCEKASAYLKHHGFKDVNQLHGGIIEYARQIKHIDEQPKFIGKNFVFDNRLGERITPDVIARCHQCGEPCDDHTNCANDDCHLLFIQCASCKQKYNGCCSNDCTDILSLPDEKRKAYRVLRHRKYADSKIFKSRLRPNLMAINNKSHYEKEATCTDSGNR